MHKHTKEVRDKAVAEFTFSRAGFTKKNEGLVFATLAKTIVNASSKVFKDEFLIDV